MLNSIFWIFAYFGALLPCLELEHQKVPCGTLIQTEKPELGVFSELGKSEQFMGYFSIILPYLWNGDVPWCFDYIFWEQTDDFVPFKRPRGKRWRLRGEKLTWQIKLGWQTKGASQEIVSIWKIVYSLIIATHIKWWLSSYTWGNPKICLTILHLIHCLSHCFYC